MFLHKVFLHRKAHTHRFFIHRCFSTKQFLHRKVLTQRNLHTHTHARRFFYTETPLHGAVFTQKNFYTEEFLHRNCYTLIFLHKETLTRGFFSRVFFTHRCWYAKKIYTPMFFHNPHIEEHLHTAVFTHTRFYAKKWSRIFHEFVICHLHIFVFDVFLVNPLLLFFRATLLFSFHIARCSVCPCFVLVPLCG